MSATRGFASQRILDLLKQTGGGLSVPELCSRLELSSVAVRRQLTSLEGDDLLFTRREKQRMGRPVRRYYLTEKGHETFERDYANLAIDVLVTLRVLEGTNKVHEVFERRKDDHAKKYRERMSGSTLETRIHQISQLLTEDGYMAVWEKVGPNRYLIKLMNCAVARVARKFPHLCIYEEELLSELLQARVARKHHILHNDHFCSYFVEGENPSA